MEDTEKKNIKKSGKKKTKKRKLKVIFGTLLVLILILAALIYATCRMTIGYMHGQMNYNEITSLADEPLEEDGVTNILLIGNDSRSKGSDGRSDAMILVSISDKTKTIHLISLLRDIYVDIPGYQGNRLNASYAFGGAELLMETLKLNFDIEVNRYVQVNFQTFANLIGALGGVDLEVTNEEVQYINGYLVEYNILEGRPEGTDYLDTSLSGNIHLNGPQALAYCRNRYIGTDFARTERQRKVLSAVFKNAPKAMLTNPTELMDSILPNLTTNLTESECAKLVSGAAKILTYDLIQESIPLEGTYSNAKIRGMAVLEVDFEKNREYIQKEIYGKQ